MTWLPFAVISLVSIVAVLWMASNFRIPDLSAKTKESAPGNGAIVFVLFAGLAVGFLFKHFAAADKMTWKRQAFAYQTTLVFLCMLVATSYALRWFQRTPADERDRYWTQIGVVVSMTGLATDKAYWSYAVYLNATKQEILHSIWRTSFAIIEVVSILGIYIGLLLMIMPWSQRWLGARMWWLPWAMVASIWISAFAFSAAW